MTLSDLASVAAIVEAIFVIISVFFIWRELRENTQLTRASNTQSLVELSSPFNLQLAQDRELTELWLRGSKQYIEMDEVDQHRYRFLLFHALTLQENIYYQHKNKLIDDETYSSWKCSFEYFVEEHNLRLHWEEIEEYYQAGFAEYVSLLLQDSGRSANSEES